jgi:ComF family protein
MNPRVKSWLEALLAFLYPPVCQICGTGRAGADEGYVCAACWSRPDGVRFIRPPFCERCGLPTEAAVTTTYECSNCREMKLHFSRARAAVVATGMVLEVIHRYKYQRALWFEPFLAGLLIRQAADSLRGEGWDGIVPVPLHPVKRREREFNQAERLARRLGQATGLPVFARLVRRVRFTPTQTALNRRERQENMRRAFAVRPGATLPGERFVVVDDVLTTGATTSACARALRQAGAREVMVWTVARGL